MKGKMRFAVPYKGRIISVWLSENEMDSVNELADQEPELYNGPEGLIKALEKIREDMSNVS